MKYQIGSLLISILFIANYFNSTQFQSSDFENWQKKYGYFNTEYESLYRESIYNQNRKLISEHNNKQNITYRMEENQFMTLTHEEFVGIYLSEVDVSIPEIEILNQDLYHPLQAVDWRNYTTVYNQGSCAAGWAFSVGSSIEAWFYIRGGGQNISVSVQQLVDCEKKSQGCSGGINTQAMLYALQDGLYNSQNYPYVGTQLACKATKSGTYFINNYTFVGGSSQSLQSSLQNYPVSVGLDATNWQFYSSGLFSNCSENLTNHFALAIGFDSTNNWVVQNSFGASWGDNGIIRLSPNNTCGILNQAYSKRGILILVLVLVLEFNGLKNEFKQVFIKLIVIIEQKSKIFHKTFVSNILKKYSSKQISHYFKIFFRFEQYSINFYLTYNKFRFILLLCYYCLNICMVDRVIILLQQLNLKFKQKKQQICLQIQTRLIIKKLFFQKDFSINNQDLYQQMKCSCPKNPQFQFEYFATLQKYPL